MKIELFKHLGIQVLSKDEVIFLPDVIRFAILDNGDLVINMYAEYLNQILFIGWMPIYYCDEVQITHRC